MSRSWATTSPQPNWSATRLGRDAEVAEAIAELPHRQRVCIVLHYFEDLSDAQIAEVLGTSVGSVKTHLHRARATLARRLEDLR